jgi:non-specific protein-tyrosine kinase
LQKLRSVIDALKAKADMVLFDTPPIMPVTDAAVLSAAVDGVMFVVDAGAVRRDVAAQAAEMLRRIGANLVGGVVNKLRADRAGGYYYYHYYYYTPEGEKRSRRRRKGDATQPPQEANA